MLYHSDRSQNLTEPLQRRQNPVRMDLRSLKHVTVSAGEIAERGSFVDLGHVRNPRTDRKHGWLRLGERVEILIESCWEAAYGVIPGTTGVACVSVGRVAKYWSQQRRKSLERVLERVFGTQKENPCLVHDFGGSPNRKTNSPKRGFRIRVTGMLFCGCKRGAATRIGPEAQDWACFHAVRLRAICHFGRLFLRDEKSAQNVRPRENCRYAIRPRLLLKDSILKTRGSNAPTVLSMPSSCLLDLRAKSWVLGVFRQPVTLTALCMDRSMDLQTSDAVNRRNLFDTAHHNGSNAVAKHVDLKPV